MSTKTFSILSIPSLAASKDILEKFSFPISETPGSYNHVAMKISQSRVSMEFKNQDLRGFDFTWLTSGWLDRDLAYASDLYLNASNTPHTSVEHAASKITDTLVFALHNLPVPDSIYVNRSVITDSIPDIIALCGFPLIIKDIKGVQGKDSHLIHDEATLKDIVADLPIAKRFIFQKFIPNDFDWGILVSNGVVVAGAKRTSHADDFRNNVHNGAKETFIDLSEIPQNIKDIAISACELLNLSWSRADIIIDKNTGDPYLLEVNRYPGITVDSDEVDGAYAFLNSHIKNIKPNAA